MLIANLLVGLLLANNNEGYWEATKNRMGGRTC